MKKIITLIFIAFVLINFAWCFIALTGSFIYNDFSTSIKFNRFFHENNRLIICEIRDHHLCIDFLCNQQVELSCPNDFVPPDTINGFTKSWKTLEDEYTKYRRQSYYYPNHDTVYYYKKTFFGFIK